MILLNPWHSQVMDAAIVAAALILNPIARRKRASEASVSVQTAETPTTSSAGFGGFNSPERADLESGGGPAEDENLA